MAFASPRPLYELYEKRRKKVMEERKKKKKEERNREKEVLDTLRNRMNEDEKENLLREENEQLKESLNETREELRICEEAARVLARSFQKEISKLKRKCLSYCLIVRNLKNKLGKKMDNCSVSLIDDESSNVFVEDSTGIGGANNTGDDAETFSNVFVNENFVQENEINL